jgi:hypothetical protein
MADSATAQWDADLAQLAELDDDALAKLESELVAAFDAADQDTSGTGGGDDAAVTELADALDSVRAEIGKRSEAPAPDPVMADGVDLAEAPAVDIAPEAAETETETEETGETAPATATYPDLVPEIATQDIGTDVVNPETAEVITPETELTEVTETNEDPENEETEGTTVAAGTVAVPKGGAVTVPKGREPVVASAANTVVVAGADIPGFSAGMVLSSGDEFGRVMAARINSLARSSGGDGEQILVASIRSEAPKDRILIHNDPEGNAEKIKELTHVETIIAAGGCCAPLTTSYDLFDCGGVSDRPVRDALAGFQADRGGIRFYAGPSLADVGGATGFWTCADDLAALDDPPGPVKACSRIECPPEQTAEIQAVTLCLTFGVMQTRIFPELAVANNKLAMVAHSRISESALLAQIKAGSKLITDAGTPLSAVRDLLDLIGRASMYYRDRYRLGGTAPLRAILPLWLLELLRGDIAFGMPVGTIRGTLSMTDADIEGFFSDRKINVTWALDSATPGTNGGGFFTDATTTLPAWPTSVQWALYPEGSWLYLDGGSLDLGIIRDSSLVRVNDYMQFSEVFEAAANIGCESLWITSTVNVSGLYNGSFTALV